MVTEKHHIFLSPSWMKTFATGFEVLFLPSASYLQDRIRINGYLILVCHNRTIYLQGCITDNQMLWPYPKTYLLSFFMDLTQRMFQITTRKHDFINSTSFVTRNTHPTNKYQKEIRRGITVVR